MQYFCSFTWTLSLCKKKTFLEIWFVPLYLALILPKQGPLGLIQETFMIQTPLLLLICCDKSSTRFNQWKQENGLISLFFRRENVYFGKNQTVDSGLPRAHLETGIVSNSLRAGTIVKLRKSNQKENQFPNNNLYVKNYLNPVYWGG